MSNDFDPDAAALEGSGIYGLPHAPEEAAVVLVPVPWDATTSYRAGTAGGPAAILEASKQVDLFDVETGRPYEGGIAMLPISDEIERWNAEARAAAEPIIAAGGRLSGPDDERALALVNDLGGRVNDWVRAEVERWAAAGKIVGVVGGDHSVPYGAIAAMRARHPEMGVLHVDAHADLRQAYEGFTWSHASIMYNVVEGLALAQLVQVGIRDLGAAEHARIEGSDGRIVTFFDAELKERRFRGETWAAECERIVAALPREVWISFDIDGLDPTLCPHTGTPVPGGLSFAEACALIGEVAKSGRRIVGFDLNEVAPGPDGDEWDANVGARLLYKLIGWTLVSRRA
jgi:agmatinase